MDQQHEVDDDNVRDGVLVRSSINAGEGCLPREKVGKALLGR